MELRLRELPRRARRRRRRRPPRTQESVAVSADGERWFLLNASPEIRQQIESFRRLHPRAPAPLADRRHPPDQRRPRPLPRPAVAARVAAARGLRDRARPPRLHRGQRALPDARALSRPGDLARARARPGGGRWPAPTAAPSGLPVEARAGAGQAADAPRGPAPRPSPRTTSASGSASGRRAAAWPTSRRSAAVTDDGPREALDGADCVFFDGTFWSSDELPALGPRHQARRGHGARARRRRGRQPGRALRAAGAARRDLHPPQQHEPAAARRLARARAGAEAAGWEVARDGMEVTPVTRHAARAAARPRTSSSPGSAREGERRYHDHHPFHARCTTGRSRRRSSSTGC